MRQVPQLFPDKETSKQGGLLPSSLTLLVQVHKASEGTSLQTVAI